MRPGKGKKLHAIKRQLSNPVDSRHGRIILLSRGGVRNAQIAQRCGCSPELLVALIAISVSMIAKARQEIERVFAVLTCTAGGLSSLPAWVRHLDRVRRWVGVKIILYNARLEARETHQPLAAA